MNVITDSDLYPDVFVLLDLKYDCRYFVLVVLLYQRLFYRCVGSVPESVYVEYNSKSIGSGEEQQGNMHL
jgi:hypothetical protein